MNWMMQATEGDKLPAKLGTVLPQNQWLYSNSYNSKYSSTKYTVRSISIWTVLQFLFFWLCTPAHWVWNEAMHMSRDCRLEFGWSFSEIHPFLYIVPPNFRGPKVIGQLAFSVVWLFWCIQSLPLCKYKKAFSIYSWFSQRHQSALVYVKDHCFAVGWCVVHEFGGTWLNMSR